MTQQDNSAPKTVDQDDQAQAQQQAPEQASQQAREPDAPADPGEIPAEEAVEPPGPAEAEPPVGDAAPYPDMAAGVDDSRVAEMEAEIDKLKRAVADSLNAQRRAEQEAEKAKKFSVTSFARDMLAVGDNLQRALMAVPEEARKDDGAIKNLVVGVEMTENELRNALGRHGIVKIDAKGQAFDPNYHQAMQEMEDASVPAGTVVQVFQDGYMIHDRLLRPSLVVVSKGGPKRGADQGGVDQNV